jgi:hypothetical protein
MTDPIEGRLGALLMSGWIGEGPDGSEYAYLLLTTPDERAPETMPLVANLLGLEPGRVIVDYQGGAVVELGADRWAGLVVGGERFERPVSPEWAVLARDRGVVVVVVGVVPHRQGVAELAYVERSGATAALGLLPCRVKT